MKNVLLLYGTRPEAVKMAPLYKALDASNWAVPKVVVTGQHREMLDQINSHFEIVPEHDLGLMAHGASLSEVFSKAVQSCGSLFATQSIDVVVVQGDTSSALAGAIAAFFNRIPVVHLEAGLRSGTINDPFPEEANRKLIAPLANLHLAPTAASKMNLLREGIPDSSIVVTGNTVIDALQMTSKLPSRFVHKEVETWATSPRTRVLVTAHRRESWGEPMRDAMRGLRRCAEDFPGTSYLFPVHKNPEVRRIVEQELGGVENVTITEPLHYQEFVQAMKLARVILTDSGGVQEEAPSLGVPVLVMRSTTERPEAVQAGAVKLVGTGSDSIYNELTGLLTDETRWAAMARSVNPYGDGRASARAVAAIGQLLGTEKRIGDFAPATPDS